MTIRTSAAGRRRFATAAMVGVVVYVLVDVVLQLLPPHYSAIRDTESDLAVGPFGWIMSVNFLGRAALTLCAMIAIGRTAPATRPRRAGMALLAVAGACSGVLAFFPTDVGAEGGAGLRAVTPTGIVHLGVAALGFITALAAFTVLTGWLRTSTGLARAFPAGTVLVAVATVGLVSLGLAAGRAPNLLGLAERVCLAGILGWAFVVCGAIRRLR